MLRVIFNEWLSLHNACFSLISTDAVHSRPTEWHCGMPGFALVVAWLARETAAVSAQVMWTPVQPCTSLQSLHSKQCTLWILTSVSNSARQEIGPKNLSFHISHTSHVCMYWLKQIYILSWLQKKVLWFNWFKVQNYYILFMVTEPLWPVSWHTQSRAQLCSHSLWKCCTCRPPRWYLQNGGPSCRRVPMTDIGCGFFSRLRQ